MTKIEIRILLQILFLVVMSLVFYKIGLNLNERPIQSIFSGLIFNFFIYLLLKRAFPND